jgi:hypothetical protein
MVVLEVVVPEVEIEEVVVDPPIVVVVVVVVPA